MIRPKIKAKLSGLPDRPGIYFFKDEAGGIVYVGKARSLRDRIRTYFQPTSDLKVANISGEIADFDFILTGSEKEAAFLENNFVQRYQPKFNLRLKDDKSFPYLRLTVGEPFPGVYLTRKVEPDGSKYFGPFSPAFQARRTIHLLNKNFGIRGCEEAVPGRRRRPCLEYDLKLCSAPCVGRISEAEYRRSVDGAVLFLEGKTEELLKVLKVRMSEAAARLDYEQAAHWRDLVRTLEQIKERPKLISVGLEDADIFGLAREKDRASVCVFLMRKGKVREAEEFALGEAAEMPDEALMARVLEAFYRPNRIVSGKILVPSSPASGEELASRLSARKGSRVRISVPKRGKDRKLVDLANRNAAILLRREREENPGLAELARILELPSLPQKIEGFDISNTGGDESVGSLVVFDNAEPNKDEYRKYKIKSVAGPNDIASLEEVIGRRYAPRLEEKRRVPDLVFVDGGKGQLHAAEETLRRLGLEGLPAASLAKREEIVYSKAHQGGLRLDRGSPALKLLQRIRDEAHRFALSYHRRRRQKKSFASALDGIPGLGEKRKRALLLKYKSLAEIRQAPLQEVAALVGSPAARSLREEGHDKGNRG